MSFSRLQPWLGTVARLLLGVVWIWASLAKLHSPRTFVQTVRAYDATWEWLSKTIGYGLPVLEFLVGVLLVLGVVTRLAAIVSTVLFVVFLIGLVQAAARGLDISCGCFGGSAAGSSNYTLDILRDVGLLIAAAYLVVWPFTHVSIEAYLARHDYVEPPSAKRMRTAEGRRKYETALAARARVAHSRAIYMNSGIGIVLAVTTLAGAAVQSGRAKISGDLTATNATVAHGVVFGTKAAATVDVYEDFQCPNCRRFEQSVGATLERDVRANLAQVRYHSMAFLSSYSTRAANAALCMSDISVDDFVAYHDVLFKPSVQPKEGSSGRSESQLIKYADSLKLSTSNHSTFTGCVQANTHKALVEAITDRASRDGVHGTPTVMVNGKSVSPTLSALKKAIAAADAKGPAPTPSPSKTSSAPAPSASAATSSSKSPSKSTSPSKSPSKSPSAAPSK